MDDKIDINLADEETLTTLPGVGDALARRIIEYRQTVHPFEEVIELAAVPGISERMVREFEDRVTVTSGMAAATPVPDVDLIPTAPVADSETKAVPDEDEAADEPPALEEIGLMDAHPDAETAVAPEPVAEEMIPEEEEAEEETAVSPTPEAESEPDTVEDEETAPLPAPPVVTDIEPTPEPEPEPEPVSEPTPVVQATPPPADWEAQAQRRGCFSAIIGAAFGAILGTALTLALLGSINRGTLTFADSDAQLRSQINTEIISRTNQINDLTTRLDRIETERTDTEAELMSTITALEGDLADAETELESLAETDAELDERIARVAGAAATFNDFLDGLRGLLDEITPATVEPESAQPATTTIPETTPTPTATAVDTPTSSPSSTETAVPPTRTPRPTATPLVFPTNTPAQQP